MGMVSNTFATYETIGTREDLADVIYNISPTETPFMSNGARAGCDNTFFEWQLDALATPDGTNARLEGDDHTSFSAVTPTRRLGNYVQISSKDYILSGTQQRVKKAGRQSEKAYQAAKRSLELKRDMETICLQNQAGVAGNDTTARKTASWLAFLFTNINKASDGVNPDYSAASFPNAARTDGTQRNIAESQLKDVLSQCWVSGGKPRLVMFGAANKQNSSKFAGIAQIRKEVRGDTTATIIGAADLYVSDFGTVSFVANRFQRSRDVHVIDPEMYNITYLRPFENVPLAKTGDADKALIQVEWGIKVFNEKAHAAIYDLNTAVL